MELLIHAGIEVNSCYWKGPQSSAKIEMTLIERFPDYNKHFGDSAESMQLYKTTRCNVGKNCFNSDATFP